MRLRAIPNRIRFTLRRPLRSAPHLWDAGMSLRPKRRRQLARRNSALVVEGFPRSGNTYLQATFLHANGFDKHVGCHRHAPAQVFRAIRFGRPLVVVIRPPREATLSYVIRWTDLSLEHALIDYIDFYRAVWNSRDDFVVSLFEDVINDAGAVVEQVNLRFGTSYSRYRRTDEHEDSVRGWIDGQYRAMRNGQLIESEVSRPSAERELRKNDMRHAFEQSETAARLAEAESLYERYRGLVAERALAIGK